MITNGNMYTAKTNKKRIRPFNSLPYKYTYNAVKRAYRANTLIQKGIRKGAFLYYKNFRRKEEADGN